jgi:SAM-dependent methyltransferase
MADRTAEGWHGWDTYAPFYDWENARTLGRRDVGFWVETLRTERGPVLELGCGTARLLAPIARSWLSLEPDPERRLIGIDRSAPMLARARRRLARVPAAVRPFLLRGDVRALPLRPRRLGAVVAAYGLLDLAVWEEYARRIPIRGRLSPGTTLTLVESVRQDRRKGLTIFDEQYVVRRGRDVRRHSFQLTFRTLPMARFLARIESAGFRIDTVCGSYTGETWHPEADVWLVLARRR